MPRLPYFSDDHQFQTDPNPAGLALALQDQASVLWMDFQDLLDSEVEPILRDTFHFHQLAIDDALKETHVPKLDDLGTFSYIVLHTIVYEEASAGCKGKWRRNYDRAECKRQKSPAGFE